MENFKIIIIIIIYCKGSCATLGVVICCLGFSRTPWPVRVSLSRLFTTLCSLCISSCQTSSHDTHTAGSSAVYLPTTGFCHSYSCDDFPHKHLIPLLTPGSVLLKCFSSNAALIQSRTLQTVLEHAVRDSLPSRWAREGPGPWGWTLYLKLNDWTEIQHAEASYLTVLFIKLAGAVPGHRLEICLHGTNLSFFMHLFILFFYSPCVCIWHLLGCPLMILWNS